MLVVVLLVLVVLGAFFCWRMRLGRGGVTGFYLFVAAADFGGVFVLAVEEEDGEVGVEEGEGTVFKELAE